MAGEISRRAFSTGVAAGLGLLATGCRVFDGGLGGSGGRRPRRRIRQPGDRPDPRRPEGTDLLPGIEHIVIYMQENHSYDCYLGALRHGDGYEFRRGVPVNANPDPSGQLLRVFHAPDTCQSGRGVSQSWSSTHTQIDSGRMDGFLHDGNTNAMRYWDRSDIPFYWSLAETFPVCDRWFASAPAQTYPNRMYLQAGTCQDLISTDTAKVVTMPRPAGGTIWEKLSQFGISWIDYAFDLPDIALFPYLFTANKDKVRGFPRFLADCRSGALPQVSIVSPGITRYSEENPGDVQLGEAYSASIINAVMHSPAWPKTVLLFMYDEHGGYYDHVPPPPAIPPDDIPPAVAPAPGAPAAWNIYGIRVPAYVISPFSKRHYVSRVVHDHTSVLRFIETKFNLGALTRRDANASNLLDCLQLHGRPPFLDPPELAAPGLPPTGSRCTPDVPPPPTEPALATTATAAAAAATSGHGATGPAGSARAERQKLLEHVGAGHLV